MAWAGSQNREQTKRKYYRFGQKLLEWVRKQGIEDLRLVQQPKLLEFVASWGDVSPYTKSNQVLMLRSLWSYGSSENVGYFLRNIASTISYDNFTDLPKAERYLEDWELEQLAHAAQMLGEKHWLVFCLLFYSGMRVGEVGRGKGAGGREQGEWKKNQSKVMKTWKYIKWL